MNVVCMRCSTRYEFDDALVSSRGTSVKCTNCGHKFRVHPPGGVRSNIPDQWLIKKTRGGSVRFETLRELQRALNDGSVTVADQISRDGRTYRPIHSVPELESFFPRELPKEPMAPRTLVGMSAPKRKSEVPRPPREASVPSKAPGAPDFEEDDVTAVYSTEQLDELRPMRSVPPPASPGRSAGGSRTPPAVGSAAPPLPNHAAVKSSSSLPSTTPRHPAVSASPARLARGVSGPPRPGASGSLPPLGQRPASAVPVPRPASSGPVAAPRASGPLPGTPTISVTAKPSTTELDTLRPTPAAQTDSGEHIVADDEPTRLGDLGSLVKQTALGLAPPPAAATQSPSQTGQGSEPEESPCEESGDVPVSDDAKAPARNESRDRATGEAATIQAPSETASEAGLRRRGRRGNAEIRLDSAHHAAASGALTTASAFDALDDVPSQPPSPPRRGSLRWVLGLLLLGGSIVGGLVLGRDYLVPKPEVATYEARVDSLLEAGHQLYRQGDLDGAGQQFAEASALSDEHPGVRAATLLVQSTRCEKHWLEARLLPAEAPEGDAVQAALGRCSERLAQLLDAAVATPAETPELIAALIDGFRIRGNLAAARSRAALLSEHATLPTAAYALAMLDVADQAPGWPTVVERLRLALGGERVPGRAHAALVYALGRSGDVEAATIQLGNMKAATRPHPLLERLEAFIDDDAEPAASAPATDTTEPLPPKVGETGDSEVAEVANPIQAAKQARARGDFQSAERYYQQALQLEPGNVAALTGLGDTARARGNPVAAISHYHAALRANPEYLPAIAGAADVNWANGDRPEAVKYYRRIGSGNAYSSRAARRIREHEAASAPPVASPSPKEAAGEREEEEAAAPTDEPAPDLPPAEDEDEDTESSADETDQEKPMPPVTESEPEPDAPKTPAAPPGPRPKDDP